jgi:transcriptional regulator with XRE-family HTH domain
MTSLAAYGLTVKPQTAKSRIWHHISVSHPLQLVFAKRLKEELDSREMSANALAKAAKARGFKLGQRSVSRMLELKQDPTLEKVYEISQTLGLRAQDLIEDAVTAVKKPLQNVVSLPPRYPKIFGKKSHSGQNGKSKIQKAPIRK